MASQIAHFPPEIEGLPDFEAHSHETNNVGVIAKGQLALTIGSEIEFWFTV